MLISAIAVPLIAQALFLLRARESTTSVSPSTAYACPEGAARFFARAYVLSNPLEGESGFFAFVQGNAALFRRGGQATQCARALGSRLLGAGVEANDPQAYERA